MLGLTSFLYDFMIVLRSNDAILRCHIQLQRQYDVLVFTLKQYECTVVTCPNIFPCGTPIFVQRRFDFLFEVSNIDCLGSTN